MNITRFFNLSILEIEEYLRSHQVISLTSRNTLPERLELTGIIRLSSVIDDKIHINKKPNIYGVYSVMLHQAIDPDTGGQSYWLTFHSRRFGVFINIDLKTMEVKGIFDSFFPLKNNIDKTKKLKDFIKE